VRTMKVIIGREPSVVTRRSVPHARQQGVIAL
jgi:hypothetical protein